MKLEKKLIKDIVEVIWEGVKFIIFGDGPNRRHYSRLFRLLKKYGVIKDG